MSQCHVNADDGRKAFYEATPAEREAPKSTTTRTAPADPYVLRMVEPRERSGGTDPKRQEGRYDQKWNVRYSELEAFKAEHGHCKAPKSHGPLGAWVNNQRIAYRTNGLPEERVRKLEDLGFVWNPQGKQPTWDERLDELTKYRAEHGHCIVPVSHGPLANWVNSQRLAHRKGKLSEERARKLDDLGIVWNPRSTPWDERFNELTEYKSEHDRCNVPRKHHGGLGSWVDIQRTAHKRGKLSKERLQKLNDLGFVWNPRQGRPKSKRRPTRWSRPRSNAGVAGEGDEDGGSKGERRNAAVDGDDAGTNSPTARSAGPDGDDPDVRGDLSSESLQGDVFRLQEELASAGRRAMNAEEGVRVAEQLLIGKQSEMDELKAKLAYAIVTVERTESEKKEVASIAAREGESLRDDLERTCRLHDEEMEEMARAVAVRDGDLADRDDAIASLETEKDEANLRSEFLQGDVSRLQEELASAERRAMNAEEEKEEGETRLGKVKVELQGAEERLVASRATVEEGKAAIATLETTVSKAEEGRRKAEQDLEVSRTGSNAQSEALKLVLSQNSKSTKEKADLVQQICALELERGEVEQKAATSKTLLQELKLVRDAAALEKNVKVDSQNSNEDAETLLQCRICTEGYGGRIVPVLMTCCGAQLCIDCFEASKASQVAQLSGRARSCRCDFCRASYHSTKSTPWVKNIPFIDALGIEID